MAVRGATKCDARLERRGDVMLELIIVACSPVVREIGGTRNGAMAVDRLSAWEEGAAASAGARVARLLALLVALAGLVAPAPAFAVQPDEVLADVGLEARARALSAELRCLVCQNQSIDDSNAPLARDLRLLVRERLAAGDSDEAVRTFVVARYGTFVLLRPPVSPSTWLLWLTPLILLGATGLAVASQLRKRAVGGRMPEPPGLTDDEKQSLEKLMRPKD